MYSNNFHIKFMFVILVICNFACQTSCAPFLKSFALVSCAGISQHSFLEAIKSFPLLEELEVTNCFFYHGDSMKAVAKACPRLKHLKRCHPPNCSSDREDADDSEALGIARMHELRSLMLVHGELTDKGLAAIVDNCRHLESLDIRRCPHIIIEDALRAKWPRINTADAPLYFDERRRVDDYYHECRLCSAYFHNRCWGTSCEFNNKEESTVVVMVRELRSMELYRNDLTNYRLRAILAKCPHLEFNDIHNCRDIILNNAMQAMSARIKLESQGIRNWRRHGDCSSIKTNKLMTKLLRNCSNCETFNP
ncbi:hypothetical protein PR202_gb29282 [Eleusine coracana subsp. coracana]|uniref:Uncharacterized protein n=1 Tax=Eleusine coracana subsp. coracana TaxID=191504 RepID=A0AAV5FZ10_ELECO|nr:hypothetical protein PR202_gb29282 [Eleusine coracana subsp. coracana]